jgi:hypothetical protein
MVKFGLIASQKARDKTLFNRFLDSGFLLAAQAKHNGARIPGPKGS